MGLYDILIGITPPLREEMSIFEHPDFYEYCLYGLFALGTVSGLAFLYSLYKDFKNDKKWEKDYIDVLITPEYRTEGEQLEFKF